MTTIKLTKSGYSDLTIHSSKVEEISNKEVINWGKVRAQAQWPSPPTSSLPGRFAVDILDMTREFTVTGVIDSSSTSAGDAQSARDTLINMQRSGGAISLKYGIAGDIVGSGYTPSANNMYYHANGFTCHITRIMIEETSKGGADTYTGAAAASAPEQYVVTIALMYAEDVT